MNQPAEVLTELRKCAGFRSLERDEMAELARDCCWMDLERRSEVFVPGDPSDCIFLLVSGRVVLGQRQDGKRAIIQSVCPQELFGLAALACTATRDSLCETTGPTSAIRIPIQPLNRLMDVKPQLAADLLRDYGRATRQLTSRLVSVLTQPKRQCLLDALNLLAKWCGKATDSGRLIPCGVTHQELGDMIGTTRETVTVILNELRREHVIELMGRQIVLLSPRET